MCVCVFFFISSPKMCLVSRVLRVMCVYIYMKCPSFLLLVVISSARISIYNSLTHSLSLILLTRHETGKNTQSNRENICVMCLCVHNGSHHEMMTRQTTITRQRTGDNNSHHRTNQPTLFGSHFQAHWIWRGVSQSYKQQNNNIQRWQKDVRIDFIYVDTIRICRTAEEKQEDEK